MSEQTITDEAVDAFRQGYLDYQPNPDTDNPRAHWRPALAAAAPLIQADGRTDSLGLSTPERIEKWLTSRRDEWDPDSCCRNAVNELLTEFRSYTRAST